MSTFSCGHERSPENTAKIGQFRVTCRACKLARSRDHYRSISRTDRQLYARVKNLPSQLDRARARVRQLETEALRLGLRDLVEHTA